MNLRQCLASRRVDMYPKEILTDPVGRPLIRSLSSPQTWPAWKHWSFKLAGHFGLLFILISWQFTSTVQPYFETMKHYILQWLIFNHFWKIRYSWNKVIEGKSQKNYITIALLSPTCTSCIFVWNLMFWWSVMGGQEDQKTDNQKTERHRTNDRHFMLCNTHALLRISFVSWG